MIKGLVILVLTLAFATAGLMVPIVVSIDNGLADSPWMIAMVAWAILDCGLIAAAGVWVLDRYGDS